MRLYTLGTVYPKIRTIGEPFTQIYSSKWSEAVTSCSDEE